MDELRLRSGGRVLVVAMVLGWAGGAVAQQGGAVTTGPNAFVGLMRAARAQGLAHGAAEFPVLSPWDATVLGEDGKGWNGKDGNGLVPVARLQAEGFKVVPWTTNDPAKMRALLALGVDGIISDRPDVLQRVLVEERAAARGDAGRLAYLARVDVTAHRGGRGLRPENTLPSFESGLDQLSTTLETDTGVTTDHVSLIWHDQFLNPKSCRRVDGAAYTLENRVYVRDISVAEAQKTFVCDKLHYGAEFGSGGFPEQRNDLNLSPVAVAFAKQEGLMSPYVPTYVEQLFRFTAFYADYYRTGPGRTHPEAAARAANAAKVRFNIETKILPYANDPAGASVAGLPVPQADAEPETNHTVGPQAFVDALCGAIKRSGMEARVEVQSFDFRTLQLVEAQYPRIPTYYLTETVESLKSALLPASLRQ